MIPVVGRVAIIYFDPKINPSRTIWPNAELFVTDSADGPSTHLKILEHFGSCGTQWFYIFFKNHFSCLFPIWKSIINHRDERAKTNTNGSCSNDPVNGGHC